jgi:hypothetical protein
VGYVSGSLDYRWLTRDCQLKGSLFTEETTAWNVASLPNVLNRLNLKRKVPGVNTPYLYFGMWAAAFAWHVEDVSKAPDYADISNLSVTDGPVLYQLHPRRSTKVLVCHAARKSRKL